MYEAQDRWHHRVTVTAAEIGEALERLSSLTTKPHEFWRYAKEIVKMFKFPLDRRNRHFLWERYQELCQRMKEIQAQKRKNQ